MSSKKLPALNEEETDLVDDDEYNDDDDDGNIIPSDRLAAQSSAQLEDELARFRNEWKMELLKEQKPSSSSSKSETNGQQQRKSNRMEHHELPTRRQSRQTTTTTDEKTTTTSDLDYEQPRTNEDKAKYLFDKAVQLEQQGRHYDAIKFYRMAMQLDADIEFKLASVRRQAVKKPVEADEEELEVESVDNDNDATVDELKTLYDKFSTMSVDDNHICEKNFPQKATHISQLPVEVIIIILKWVVSEHLDMRSLDNFAAVCKGFYVLGRDPRIWRLACAKIWGENNINNYLSSYQDWRAMYLQRPRLNFDGVYISKASYARAGEQGLDNFYQPWHLVEYYRYLRFFADGTVYFLTTPDEPKLIVGKLKSRAQTSAQQSQQSQQQQHQQQQQSNYIQQATGYQPFIMNEHAILRGTWTLALKKVSIVLIKRILKAPTASKYSRRQIHGSNREPILEQEHVFRLELELNGKMNNQLHWVDYNIDVINKITNSINNTKMDLNRIDFPNFYYSRVKSYANNSDMPLK